MFKIWDKKQFVCELVLCNSQYVTRQLLNLTVLKSLPRKDELAFRRSGSMQMIQILGRLVYKFLYSIHVFSQLSKQTEINRVLYTQTVFHSQIFNSPLAKLQKVVICLLHRPRKDELSTYICILYSLSRSTGQVLRCITPDDPGMYRVIPRYVPGHTRV